MRTHHLTMSLVLGFSSCLALGSVVACEPEADVDTSADDSDGDADDDVGDEGSCTNDAACAADAYCDLQTQGCTAGCRSNSSCPAGEFCDGRRQCVPLVDGGGAFNDSCDDDGDCDDGLFCSIASGTCGERCTDNDDCQSCTAAQTNERTCICNAFGVCSPS